MKGLRGAQEQLRSKKSSLLWIRNRGRRSSVRLYYYHFQPTNVLAVLLATVSDPKMTSLAGRISRHFKFHLRVQTRAFNVYHDNFSLRWTSRNYLRRRKILLLFYDIGSILGVFGMFAAVVMLVWTAVSLSSSAFLRLTIPHTSTRLLKRAAEASSRPQTYSSAYAVNPIVS